MGKQNAFQLRSVLVIGFIMSSIYMCTQAQPGLCSVSFHSSVLSTHCFTYLIWSCFISCKTSLHQTFRCNTRGPPIRPYLTYSSKRSTQLLFRSNVLIGLNIICVRYKLTERSLKRPAMLRAMEARREPSIAHESCRILSQTAENDGIETKFFYRSS